MYRWVDHVSELELELAAPTEEAVFEAALEAFWELVADDVGSAAERREVLISGEDRAAFLVGWLEELIFLAETEGFVPERLAGLELDPGGLRAGVAGHTGEPRPLVKAATLHRLQFAPDADGWHARVVLDV